MSNYASTDVFDLSFYHNGILLFKVDSAKSVNLSRENGDETFLSFEDSLINDLIMDEVFSGDIDGKKISIIGESVWVGFEGEDAVRLSVRLSITESKFIGYNLNSKSGNPANASLLFMCPTKDENGKQNIEIKVAGDEG